MKIINKILTVFFVFFAVAIALAETPPPPASTAKSMGANEVPPPPPELPIGDNLLMLMLSAILLGIYILYKHKLKTKASV